MKDGGLIVGIDVQDTGSQVCFFDFVHKTPQNVVFPDGRAVLDVPVRLSEWPDVHSKGAAPVLEKITEHFGRLIERAKIISKIPKIDQLCITTSCFRPEVLDLIAAVLKRLMYMHGQWTVMGHEECYACYAYNQKKELYLSGIMLLDFEADGIHAHVMQRGKRNQTEFIMEKSFLLADDTVLSVYEGNTDLNQIEERLTKWLKDIMADYVISSVYLTGKGFDTEAFPAALTKLLCTHRKVFAGQNLFVKGACYGAYEAVYGAGLQGAVLACRNRITTGIEMDILEHGAAKRFRVVKPGTNWYMAYRQLDFILEDIRKIRLIMRPCDDSGDYEEWIDISEIPYRPGKRTRIGMTFVFTADDRCRISVCDKGFGSFVKSAGKTIHYDLKLRS